MSIGIKATYVVLIPIAAASVPNGSFFLDSGNGNAASVKTSGGVSSPLNTADTSLFIKQMVAGGPIAINRPFSKRIDGKIIAADSDAVGGQIVLGHTLAAVASDGDLVSCLLLGGNLAGALTGLGFSTADAIYLSQTGGFTNDPNSFTGDNDSIIRIGFADCAAGLFSTTATDLVIFSEILLRP